MGYRTLGHIRCSLTTRQAAELLEAAYRCQPPPTGWLTERAEAELRLYAAAAALRFETFRRCAISREVCMSFEARDDDARAFMNAMRPLVEMASLAHVWGYLCYEGDMQPIELFSSCPLTMQRPDPDIVVHHK